MKRTLLLVSFRYLLGHPLHTCLSMIGICLGVAVVVAIDLSNYSAKAAFALSTDAIAGKATHYISSDSGGVSEEIYRKLIETYRTYIENI